MKISYFSLDSAENIHAWSGLNYYIGQSLEQQGAHLNYGNNLGWARIYSYHLKKHFYKLLGKEFLFDRTKPYAKKIAVNAAAAIQNSTDVIFSPTSLFYAYLKTDKPKVLYCDATFELLINFYDAFKNLSAETIKYGNEIERLALQNCDLAIYSSAWAANSAINFYGANPNKVKVVPFGANIAHIKPFHEIENLVQKRGIKMCNLLFMGIDWERKGGVTALNVARILNEMGLPTSLHIAGVPEIPDLPPYVKSYGFISKKTEEGQQQIDKLYADSHFLILPTKADCTPVVFSEANSNGLPVISTNVGGIPTIIENGINGITFSLDAAPQQYAEYIFDVFNDEKRYQRLCMSSYKRFQEVLNWDAAGRTIMNYLKDLI
ncbi:glycosyltransferase family 4 protein [Mucilaginibacter sp. HD30]